MYNTVVYADKQWEETFLYIITLFRQSFNLSCCRQWWEPVSWPGATFRLWQGTFKKSAALYTYSTCFHFYVIKKTCTHSKPSQFFFPLFFFSPNSLSDFSLLHWMDVPQVNTQQSIATVWRARLLAHLNIHTDTLGDAYKAEHPRINTYWECSEWKL